MEVAITRHQKTLQTQGTWAYCGSLQYATMDSGMGTTSHSATDSNYDITLY